MTWFFWLHVIIYDYFSSVFCIVPKKVLLLKYRKWVSHLKNRYHYAKVVENARINFSISPSCTLLFSRRENFKFLEVALSAVLCNDPVGYIMNVWGYQHWNTANTALDIYLLFENGHKHLFQPHRLLPSEIFANLPDNCTLPFYYFSGVTEGVRWVRSHHPREETCRFYKNVLPHFYFCPAI